MKSFLSNTCQARGIVWQLLEFSSVKVSPWILVSERDEPN